MKLSILLNLVFGKLVNASSSVLTPAAEDACQAPHRIGTCQPTRECKTILYLDDHRLKGPENAQCCVNPACNSLEGQRICRHTKQGYSSAHLNSGSYCPADNAIQCSDLLRATTITNECSHPKPDTCSFYSDCLESYFQCGPSGYPIGYGFKYCNRFSIARSQMSAAGQIWVTNTMLCLQRALAVYSDGSQTATCSKLKDYAFRTHPDCYVRSGVCTLPLTDWEIIINTVSFKVLFQDFDALKATYQAIIGCIGVYLWLVGKTILKLFDGYTNNRKSR